MADNINTKGINMFNGMIVPDRILATKLKFRDLGGTGKWKFVIYPDP
jgi:hypothetical protein